MICCQVRARDAGTLRWRTGGLGQLQLEQPSVRANRGVGWRRGLRAELLHVLMLPDLERAQRIGEFWSYAQSRTFAELLIDCAEDRTLRAVLVGMLREGQSLR